MTDDGGRTRTVLAVAGLAAAVLGVLLAVRPGLAAPVGLDGAAVTVLGLLALVQFLRVARSRRAGEVRTTGTPDVETIPSMPTPGDEFDRRVAGLDGGPRRGSIRRRNDLRETLSAVAVDAIVAREGCSRERAREQLAAGTWTDDPHAAAFLGGEEAPEPPLADRLRALASEGTAAQFRVRRATDAVARTAGIDADRAREER